VRLGWEIRNVIKLTGTGFGLKVLCALGNIVRLTGTGLRLRLVLMLFGDLGNGFVPKNLYRLLNHLTVYNVCTCDYNYF
jgi:hypothetical protein